MMSRRTRFAILSIAGAILYPALALAAQDEAGGEHWSGLIFYIVNFVLFIWLVKYFGGAMISGFFRDRAKTIRSNITGAEKELREAEALSVKAASLIEHLEDEKLQLARELTAETAYQVKHIDQQAGESVERIRRDAAVSAAALREAGQRHLRATLAAGAARIAAGIVRKEFQPADQARLLETFVGRLGEEAR